MASICHRCALRLQRAAQAEIPTLSKRTFSSTTTRQRTLPTFTEASNPELNNVLATLREKHFIPAYLRKQERKMIFKHEFKQYLQDNPQTVYLGEEEVQLQWIDRNRDIPARKDLVNQALNLIAEGESSDWQNLPKLLQALNEGVKKPATPEQMEKIMRKALQNGKIGIIIQCLQQAGKTGMTLNNEHVLRSVISGLHELAVGSDWSESATGRALRDANVVSLLLESEEHGTGRKLTPNDPRTRPEVLGVFLELTAVYAYKFEEAKDTQGLVKAYAGRLLSNLKDRESGPNDVQLLNKGKQYPMLFATSIWHGLTLAQKILGKEMPEQSVAIKAIQEYESTISRLAEQLKSQQPAEGTYAEQALTAWEKCIRD
ncbi:hypothetical protein M409DRAFT_63978 [Zasmidium cellare ATCC 36951]|uniref:Uncharacterized protein n=1 Tax=Zasmidium cellare ATCC 36951 TaxID=1080233 RepID=A0A6A6CVA8_ZASCE|nr:uncharacterized protein M409DRAFT_63978 [Zasmidium cellare ATCC 36951]KAF2170975.1 hypothetical protein M409DRAFT_63978 [Zasmidium cellare ATCC 36951]